MKSKLILKDKTIYIGEIKSNKSHGKGILYKEPFHKEDIDIPFNLDWIKKGIFKNGDFVKGQIKGFAKIVEGKFKKGKPMGKAKISFTELRC